ncbi:MAG: serine/threonine protein kinase [Ignavibacteriaceae bacterium]|nr:serine/threonine protein kinase [Ignavibacteriaceae bacterium]
MNKDRLNRVKELFDKAIIFNQKERESYLDNECCNDVELKNEVISLITSFEVTKDFLEEPLAVSEQAKINFADPYIGKQIGNYVIDGEAGVGGMGIVYSGKRNDKEFEQKVAIKILKHGISSEYLLKRFQIERQTLAYLQHPNIARLLDGGRTVDGLPYLIMEFIDGIPITQYCLENKLSIEQTLNLFIEVCNAVQYAHQNLVIHRDLKPGNILITKNGNVKLLDFGIAKLIDEDLVDFADGLTKTGVWHLTPEYASPEQIKGEKITTASDVYSLGVLLYQIMTGFQPYKITNNSPTAISKIITEEKIIKPSEKLKEQSDKESNLLAHSKSFSRIRGDLDNIVLKAMSKDPLRRYVSVEQFSEDIRRHLIGLPVIAQKDTAGYRLNKFIQRHKVGFTSSVVFSCFVVVSLIAILWQANVAAEERDNAKLEAQKVETVNKFLQDMLSSVDPTEIGRDVKVYDVLHQSALNLEKSFSEQPEIEAAIQKTIGVTFTNLGEYDEAKPHLERSVKLNEKVYGLNDFHTAESYHALALYYHWIGNLKFADSLYKKGLRIFRSDTKTPKRVLAGALNDYATLKYDFAEFNEARKLHEESLDLYLKYVGKKNKEVSSVYNNLAIIFQEQKDFDKAEEYFNKALKINIELLGESRPEVSINYNNLAYLFVDKNQFDKAEEYFKKSLELKIKYYGNDHSMVGLAYSNLSAIQERIGKIDDAEKTSILSIKNLEKSVNQNHIWLGLAYFRYTKVLVARSKYNNAFNYINKALNIQEDNYPEDHPNLIASLSELGVIYFHQNKFADAEKYLIPGYEKVKKLKGANNYNTVRLLKYLLKLYQKTNNSQKLAIYQALLDQTQK